MWDLEESRPYGRKKWEDLHTTFQVEVYKYINWDTSVMAQIQIDQKYKLDAFELWYWRRLLRIPWTARRSNQPILKKINPEYSLGRLWLKLQYFAHLMWRADSLEKTLMLGKIEGKRRRGRQRMKCLDGITNSMDMSLKFEQVLGVGDGQGSLACCSPCGCKQSDMTEQLNWLADQGKAVCYYQFSSVQFSHSVVSDSLRSHEPQHARPPCPSPTPRVHPNSYPLSRWCHPTISSSVVPFSFCPQSFPTSGALQRSQLFASGGQSIGVSASI